MLCESAVTLAQCAPSEQKLEDFAFLKVDLCNLEHSFLSNLGKSTRYKYNNYVRDMHTLVLRAYVTVRLILQVVYNIGYKHAYEW